MQTFDGIVEGHNGEIFGLAFVPDGTLIATAGWDGYLRLWDPQTSTPLVKLRASAKPLSACAVSPDGKQYLTGSMEGILAVWDAATQQPVQTSVVHTRPIADIRFSPNGTALATAGWDRLVQLRSLEQSNDIKGLYGHQDILAGCTFFPGGQELLSWGADGTLRVWDTTTGAELYMIQAHTDRVTAASLSPDGTQVLTGSRDGLVKLWDLADKRELATLTLNNEVRGVFFLLDAESAITVDAEGVLVLVSLPNFLIEGDIQVGHKIMCASLSPSGQLVALGGEDGYLYQVGIEGQEESPLFVTPKRTLKPSRGLLARLFGRGAPTEAFAITCPRCRATSELRNLPEKPVACRNCRQALRINPKAVLVG
jgi:WD40 repeat protein